nr:TlpA disulfide reductase family protein [Teredinibacter haidensis]
MLKTKHLLKSAIILLSAVFTLALAPVSMAEKPGKPAIDFTLKSNQGKNVRLSDLRGQVVMLNFWASWCGPCRQEMPLLDKIHKKYSPAGFTLLGINSEEDSKEADRLLKQVPVSFPILYDTTLKVNEYYKVDAMPSSVMIDCDGNMSYIHRGYKPGDEKAYIKHIKGLLRSCSN